MRLAIWLSLLLVAACNGARDAKDAPRAATQPSPVQKASEFEPPDANGWGRAAGLRYLERCFGCPEPDAKLPLLIMIHGLGDKPRPDWFPGAELIRTPLRMIMPQAPTPYNGGFAWFPYRVGHNDPDALARGISTAEAQLADAIEVLRTRRPTRGRPIVAGFSQGGMLSFALALRHPERVELSHPMAGMLPRPLWPTRKPDGVRYPRILAIHGDADDIVPIDGSRQLVAHLKGLGMDAELREIPGVRHTISDEMVRYTVEVVEQAAPR